MYDSQKWLPTDTKGLQHRCGNIFIFRKRIKGVLHRIYLGDVHLMDAELIAQILDKTPPQDWKEAVECTKKFCAWELALPYT